MKVILFANTDWYLYNFRLDYARFLRDQGWEVVLMAPEGEYHHQFGANGFRYIPFNFSRKGINPLVEWDTIRRIESIYRQEKPDLVHHFTVKSVIYGSLAAKRVGIRAIVNSITGLGYLFLGTSPLARMIRSVASLMYRRALQNTEVIFENPDDAALFLSMQFVTEPHCHVILGTGFDPALFHPVPAPDSIPLVILPARMLWDKGIGEFVSAAETLRAENIPARFALVGKKDDGNPSSISYEQLTRWQKEGNVEWWGWQEDIMTVISISDIVCLPSYREGLPRILIEAAACGRPIVTTDVPGCREIVKDSINGFLVPPKTVEPLADALRKLILDRELRNAMGEKSYRFANECFSNQIVNQATFCVYQLARRIA